MQFSLFCLLVFYQKKWGGKNDLDPKFVSMTDSSEVGTGEILLQYQKIMGIYSYKFSGSECKHSVVEKKMFALVKAIIHFKSILYNCRISVTTYSLNQITKSSNINRRVNRWKLCLAISDITYNHYIEGNKDVPADWLSRNFTLQDEWGISLADLEWVSKKAFGIDTPVNKKTRTNNNRRESY